MNTLVVDGAGYGKAVEGLNKISTNVVEFFNSPHLFNLVLFTGGEDVDPSLYNHTSLSLCQSNLSRDVYEAEIFAHALNHKIKMAGICRGLQFLNVMNGGTMIHHLSGHGGTHHDMETFTGEKIRVNSLHHQMVVPGSGSVVIGWCPIRLSGEYYGNNDLKVKWPGPEIEAVYYPSTGCVGVQYHPEIMPIESMGYKFFWNLCKDLITHSKDLFLSKYRRTDVRPVYLSTGN